MNTLQLGNINLFTMTVTPEIARHWLAFNKTNRRIRKLAVEQYARDMVGAHWQLKPVAICFRQDGSLGNGQHTLLAITTSGLPQLLLIAEGCTDEQIAVMDVGLKRTVQDIAHFLQLDISKQMTSIARALEWGPGDATSRSFVEVYEAYLKYEDDIRLVMDHAPSAKKGFPAAAAAAIVRAYHHVDADILRRFMEILATGIAAGEHESSAIRLRDYLLSTVHGRTTAEETFRKTTSAIDAFKDGRPLQKIYGTSKNIFPAVRASAPRV